MKLKNQNKETIEEVINDCLKLQQFDVAEQLAKEHKLIDKLIETYDSMIKYHGRVSSKYAGDIMKFYGMFNKAKKYYEAFGEKKEVEKLKKVYITNPRDLIKTQKKIIKDSEKLEYEEKKSLFELIYKVKEEDFETIDNLTSIIKWKPFMEDLINLDGKN